MGLDSIVMMSVTSLMQLPQVLLLPLGVMNDCIPILGYNRKLDSFKWVVVSSSFPKVFDEIVVVGPTV